MRITPRHGVSTAFRSPLKPFHSATPLRQRFAAESRESDEDFLRRLDDMLEELLPGPQQPPSSGSTLPGTESFRWRDLEEGDEGDGLAGV